MGILVLWACIGTKVVCDDGRDCTEDGVTKTRVARRWLNNCRVTTKVLARSMICATRESVGFIINCSIQIRATRYVRQDFWMFSTPASNGSSARTETPVQSMTIVRIQSASPDRKELRRQQCLYE